MKHFALFLAINLAVVLVLAVSMRLLGAEPYLNEQGLNLTALLVFAAVIGFGGAFISLAISKWTARKSMDARIIAEPRTSTEQWLVPTVARQARAAGISGGVAGGLKRLFMSHPPMEERIATLKASGAR